MYRIVGETVKEEELERLKNMLLIEESLYDEGYEYICGVDEAGRGPLCGPVVAAAVILPKHGCIEGVNDSKKISEKKREKLYDDIMKGAIAVGIGISDVEIKRYAYIIYKAFVSEYEDEVIIEGIAQDIKAKYLNSLLELMNKYGFSLPIVDVSTGEPIIIEPEMLLEETPIEFIDKHPYRQRKYIRKKVLEILERK